MTTLATPEVMARRHALAYPRQSKLVAVTKRLQEAVVAPEPTPHIVLLHSLLEDYARGDDCAARDAYQRLITMAELADQYEDLRS